MKKIYFTMVLISIAVATVSTTANAKSTLQIDIDAGATPLTTSQLTSIFTGNTIVGEGFYVFHPKGKKRIVLFKNKIHKRKWRVDEEKGWCVVRVKPKKWICTTVWQIGPNKYRYYDTKGKETFTVSVEQGNIKGLE